MSRRQQSKIRGVREPKASLHRGRLAAVLVSVVVVASCSTSGEDTGSTTSVQGSTSVTAAGSDATSVDLNSLLPEASDLGPDYTVTDKVADDEGDEAFDEAFIDACPAAARLIGEDPDEVKRSYERSDGPTVVVAVAPAGEGWSEADLDEVLDAFEACEQFSFTHDGIDVSLYIGAQRSDMFGEFGMQTRVDMNLEADGLPEPLHLRTESVEFVAEGVGVRISASDGMNDQTGSVMSGDFGLLDPLATQIEGRLGFVHPTTTTVPESTAVPPATGPDPTTIPSTAPPTPVTPTTSAATPLPGSQCTLGSHPDCIDPDGDGVGTFLIGGAECMRYFADTPSMCIDLDGDGRAGYPDSG